MEIIVQVNKKKTEIVGERKGRLILNVKGKAENNEANNEIVRFFSKNKRFNNNFLKVKIIKGIRSKNKVLRLGNV